MPARARAYCFTYNNYDQEGIDRLQALDHKYLVYGKEVADSGTPHLQGLIIFPLQRSFNAVKKDLLGCHIEAAADSHASMVYCKKDGDVYESGTAPTSKAEMGQMEKDRYKRAREAATAGNLEDIEDDLYVRHYSTFKKIKEDHQVKPPSTTDITGCFFWYYGPSGSGKSRQAHEENPDAHLKNPTKWWDGYQPGHTVIIDEWDPHHSVLASHLKRWADHHPFSAEVKCGTRILRPPKIIVTSNYSILECFPEPHDHLPLQRRFKEVLFSVPHAPSCPQGAMSHLFSEEPIPSAGDAF